MTTSLPRTATLALPTADRARAYAYYGPAGLGLPTPGDLADDGVPEPLRVVVNDGLELMLVPTGGFGWTIAGRAVAEPGTVECQLSLSLATVADVDAFTERARTAGGDVAIEPEERGWACAATVADPDGHLWTALCTSAER